MHNLWSARKEAVWAMSSQRPEGTKMWSTDVAVPLSRMPEIIGECTSPACRVDPTNSLVRSLKARVRGLGSIL